MRVLNITSSCFTAERDLREVIREANDIKFRYHEFGICLHLPQRELQSIQMTNYSSVDRAFSEVLLVWLRHNTDERHNHPTWRRLVEAVDDPAGGNNHALAKTIAEHHRATTDSASESNHAQLQPTTGIACLIVQYRSQAT